MGQTSLSDYRVIEPKAYVGPSEETAMSLAAEPVVAMMTNVDLEKLIKQTEKQMEAAAKDLDFLTAAKLRDELAALKQVLKTKRD